MEPINIKVFHGKEGFYKIKDDWKLVVDGLSRKTLPDLYEGYKSYIDTINGNDDISIFFFLMYRNNKPFAIFPIQSSKKNVFGFKFRVLQSSIGSEAEMVDFIYEKEESNEKLLNILIDNLETYIGYNWNYIILPVLEDSSVYFSLKSFNHPLWISNKIGGCYFLRCGSYEEINRTLSKNFKANLRQTRNRLSREEKVEFISIRKKDDLHRAFHQLVDIEASGWKSQRGTALKQDYKVNEFYENLVDNLSKNGNCEINLLRVNDKNIAGSLCFLADDIAYVLKVGYDENFSYLRPGVILMDELIKRYSGDSSINLINTVATSEWIAKWKPFSIDVYQIMIFNKSLSGLLIWVLIKCEFAKKEIYAKFLTPMLRKVEKYIKSIRKAA